MSFNTAKGILNSPEAYGAEQYLKPHCLLRSSDSDPAKLTSWDVLYTDHISLCIVELHYILAIVVMCGVGGALFTWSAGVGSAVYEQCGVVGSTEINGNVTVT